jgi:hypothetical protein
VELTDHHRWIYRDPSIGGDDPGTGFDAYLAAPERIAFWVAELAGFGRGTDGRVRTRTNRQAEPVVTAGRRGQEIGQLLIGRVVSEAA